MLYFDFVGLRVDEAFRQFCQKLYLKAETQEIDRILDGFSQRYFQCNPATIFGSPSQYKTTSIPPRADLRLTTAVIHVVTGSFLLLNTDLHIADISQHMSRNQFVRLTLDTITANLQQDGAERASTPDLVRDDSSGNLSLATSTVTPAGPGQVPPPQGIRGGMTPRTNSVYSTLSARESIGGSSLDQPLGLPGTDPKSRISSAASMSSTRYSKSWESELETALRVGRTCSASETGTDTEPGRTYTRPSKLRRFCSLS